MREELKGGIRNGIIRLAVHAADGMGTGDSVSASIELFCISSLDIVEILCNGHCIQIALKGWQIICAVLSVDVDWS